MPLLDVAKVRLCDIDIRAYSWLDSRVFFGINRVTESLAHKNPQPSKQNHRQTTTKQPTKTTTKHSTNHHTTRTAQAQPARATGKTGTQEKRVLYLYHTNKDQRAILRPHSDISPRDLLVDTAQQWQYRASTLQTMTHDYPLYALLIDKV